MAAKAAEAALDAAAAISILQNKNGEHSSTSHNSSTSQSVSGSGPGSSSGMGPGSAGNEWSLRGPVTAVKGTYRPLEQFPMWPRLLNYFVPAHFLPLLISTHHDPILVLLPLFSSFQFNLF